MSLTSKTTYFTNAVWYNHFACQIFGRAVDVIVSEDLLGLRNFIIQRNLTLLNRPHATVLFIQH
jgi:hypothetical protein